MSAPLGESHGALRSVEALLRLRDVECRQARAALQIKQAEVDRLGQELHGLQRRRGAVLGRGGARVLRERLLLDALMQIALERGRKLRALKAEAKGLVQEYRGARSRRDAVESLRDRRRLEREAHQARRAEVALGDDAASRLMRAKSQGRDRSEERPCED